MLNRIAIYGLMLLLPIGFLSCKVVDPNKVEHSKEYSEMSYGDKWLTLMNKNPERIIKLYSPNALKVMENGEVLDRDEIVSSLEGFQKKFGTITYYAEKFSVKANNEYRYVIGEFGTKENKTFSYISIQKETAIDSLREFEFSAETFKTRALLTEIDAAREQWVKLCNEHDASVLVSELYTENAVYYNHKPVKIGTEAITETYGYMNNDAYKLSLQPLYVHTANDTIVYEIGQCEGTYNGKYLLVWKKEASGKWKVFIDSNI